MDGAFEHRGHVRRRSATPELVDALLDAAGLVGPWTVENVPTVGWVNRTTVIRLPDGELVAAREYGWPFAGTEPFDRRAKECWIHPRLAAAGVPVAQVLASASVGPARGVLLSHVPGETLGAVASRVDPASLATAWEEAGAALRAAHGVEVPAGRTGLVAADGVLPFAEGSFGAYHRDRITAYAERLAREAPDLGVDADRVGELAHRAQRVIDDTQPVLGHGDPHAWNVLVVPGPGGRWRLSGWLDWEFAWVADPAWDHMRMVVQRFADFGPTPDAWWDGYGRRADPPNLAVSVLHFMVWKALDHLDGVESKDAEVALRWLHEVDRHLDELSDLLPA